MEKFYSSKTLLKLAGGDDASSTSLPPWIRHCLWPEAVQTKCIIYGEALRIRVKKFKHNLPENYSTSTKIAITACKLSKIFWGSMPPDPPKFFLSLHQLQINSAEKNTLKKCGNYAPSPFKSFCYATAGPGCR